MSEMVWIRTGIGAEVDFLKLDNMCLRVVFYDENNSLTKVIEHNKITINPPLQFKISKFNTS
jgi:hypothetical protein